MSARAIAACAGALAFALAPALAGQEPANLRVSQARAAPPSITAFVEVLDRGGRPLSNLDAGGFSAALGTEPARVTSAVPFARSGLGVAYVFLVDVSRSLSPREFAQIQQALGLWINGMTPRDRAAVIAFGERARFAADFTGSRDSLRAAVAALAPTEAHTALYDAVAMALDLERRGDPALPARRVVVLLSDGQNNAPGGLTREELTDRMRGALLPLYVIGYTGTEPGTGAGLQTLAEFARRSGGAYVPSGALPLAAAYTELRARIGAVHVLNLDCPRCSRSTAPQRLSVTYASGGRVVTDGVDVRPFPGPAVSRPAWRRWVVPGVVAALLLAAALVLVALRRGSPGAEASTSGSPARPPRRRRRRRPVPQPEPEMVVPVPPPLPPPDVKDVHVPTQPAPRGVPVHFAVIRPDSSLTHRSIQLVDTRVVGRVGEVPFPDDPKMSARHFALELNGRTVLVRDLDSRNGTFVNGVPVAPTYRLEEGDVIQAGETRLRVSFGDLPPDNGITRRF